MARSAVRRPNLLLRNRATILPAGAGKARSLPKVRLSLADSRVFLRDLLAGLPNDRPVLFYLDAHWNEDLPLAEEARLIVEQAPLAVVMIDDFCVPFDPGLQLGRLRAGQAPLARTAV